MYPVLNHMIPDHIRRRNYLKVNFSIFFTSMSSSRKWSHTLRFSDQNCTYFIPRISCTISCAPPDPSFLILLGSPMFSEDYKLQKLSPTFCNSLSFRFKLGTPISILYYLVRSKKSVPLPQTFHSPIVVLWRSFVSPCLSPKAKDHHLWAVRC
jgi:hypothetical protein